MLTIRISIALIALIVIIDFAFSTWRMGDGGTALTPAFVGAVVIATLCWRDAAANRRRRLLAWCTVLLAGCLTASLLLEIILHRATGSAWPQIALLVVLCVTTIRIAQNALVASRRRRERIGLLAYYQTDDDEVRHRRSS